MGAAGNETSPQPPLKLTGLDLMFGLPRSEWVTLFRETVDIDRLRASLDEVLEQFPVLKGRLVKRGPHLFVEQFDAGVQVEVLDSEHPAPAFGPDIFPVLANGLVPELPPVPLAEQEKRPVAAFRFIRYSDGRVVVGSSICHGLVDAGSAHLFFAAWRKAYWHEPAIKPLIDRSIVLKLAGENVSAPSTKSGLMRKPFDPKLFATPPQASEFFGMTLSEAEYRHLVERVKQRFSGAVSFNNYLQAMLLKVFAQSCQEEGSGTTHANMSYDLRRMGPGVVPVTYFGGATIFRSFPATFDDLRHSELRSIAQRFKELGRLDIDEVSQDVGYLQAQYEAGNTNDYGSFSEFLSPLVNKGLYINNLLGLGRAELNPESNLIWSEMPLRMPFTTRMATVLINHDGGISIRMALPIGQRDLFLEKWNTHITPELQA